METRLDRDGFEKYCGDLPFKNKLIVKKPKAGGGLALLWRNDVNLDVINFTDNHILAKVVEDDGFVWFLTGFYGWPEASEKKKSWALLSHLKTFVNGPWCCIGDFNAILHSSEKQSLHSPPYSQMDEFCKVLEVCQLADLGFQGNKFTWTNRRPGEEYTKQRLDRAVANRDWVEKFSASSVTHLFSHAFDHLPILLRTMKDRSKRGRGVGSFKFEESWLMWDDCGEVVAEAWTKGRVGSSSLETTMEKIRISGAELLAWGSSKTRPETEEIKRLQKRLEELNEREMTEDSKEEFLVESKKLDALLRQQEIFWRQRSRISWLNHGDRNTKFFHNKASQRRQRNYIQGIKTKNGDWVEEIEEVAKVASYYFQNIFKAGACDKMEECLNAIPHKMTDDMLEVLSRSYSREEVKAALFQMRPTKAPGPDGMNALFYQKFWHIVGSDVTDAVLDFLHSGYMVPEMNYTHIVLIPKVKKPDKMSNFRPISLCNVIYKIISKVMTNRLKRILSQLISPTQSAFVPGRLIFDNVLVAYEILHAMHLKKKGKKGALALKIGC